MLATGLATLVVGLVAFVAATVFFIRNRLKYKKSKPNESEGYIEMQRSNPVFTEPYSTLQSQPESGPLQEQSADTYDECGIAPDVDTYQSIEEGVDCFSVMLATGKPDLPKDVRINVTGSSATISWTIPTNIQGATWSRIHINNSTGVDIVLDSKNSKTYKDIPVSKSRFEINNLKMCSEYIVRINFLKIAESKFTSKKFWMTSKFSFP
ncbi:unnamed protein product [Mytilus coruscus]|uniref:Fibronectin type-III domain-containing protein n=1 Tax=Mytilus coruscus TaxID=42192 RepID=A0A6J8AUN6_MYTCO|nr:unnamed protein product [Mytilus coruscus]